MLHFGLLYSWIKKEILPEAACMGYATEFLASNRLYLRNATFLKPDLTHFLYFSMGFLHNFHAITNVLLKVQSAKVVET